jgi:hypothetical protein
VTYDAPNALRNPPLLGADLLAEWTRPMRGWQLGAFVQLHSPVSRVSTGGYAGTREFVVPAQGGLSGGCGAAAECLVRRDDRGRNIPALPLVGLRVAF